MMIVMVVLIRIFRPKGGRDDDADTRSAITGLASAAPAPQHGWFERTAAPSSVTP